MPPLLLGRDVNCRRRQIRMAQIVLNNLDRRAARHRMGAMGMSKPMGAGLLQALAALRVFFR